MKQKAVESIYVDELNIRDEVNTRPEPSEELEPIQLDDHLEHLAYVSSKLAQEETEQGCFWVEAGGNGRD